MSASITKNVNKRKLNPPGRCALVQVLRAMTSTVTGKEYSIIPKVRVDGMILHVNAYSAGKGVIVGPLSFHNFKKRLASAE